MAIIQTINTHGQFADAFQRMGRGDQFTYSALGALFDYYNEMDEPIELDPVAICCEWAGYNDALDAAEAYGYEVDREASYDEQVEDAMDWLNDQTMVLTADSGAVIVQSF